MHLLLQMLLTTHHTHLAGNSCALNFRVGIHPISGHPTLCDAMKHEVCTPPDSFNIRGRGGLYDHCYVRTFCATLTASDTR
jgi:hypothetical protein